MKRNQNPKPSARTSFAARIKAASTIQEKYEIARGMPLFLGPNPKSVNELKRIVDRWRVLTGKGSPAEKKRLIEGGYNVLTTQPLPESPVFQDHWHREIAESLALLGKVVAEAIIQKEHLFFSRMAPILQFNRLPLSHTPGCNTLYLHILEFCYWEERGSESSPMPAESLVKRLRHKGHKFGNQDDKKIPRPITNACELLGVVLYARPIGRPQKVCK